MKNIEDTLLDYDTATIIGLAMDSVVGADAAPYFRIFNPITQSEKFDPDGRFIKKWVPELKALPKKFIHKPWEISEDLAAKINFNLKQNYYEPIVNHAEARQAALAAFEYTKKMKQLIIIGSGISGLASAYYLKNKFKIKNI